MIPGAFPLSGSTLRAISEGECLSGAPQLRPRGRRQRRHSRARSGGAVGARKDRDQGRPEQRRAPAAGRARERGQSEGFRSDRAQSGGHAMGVRR